MNYTVKIVQKLLPEAIFIREIVFVQEQGFHDEWDDIDPIAHHIVVWDGKQPIATGRLFPQDDTYKIGRIAVLPVYRGKGIGKLIMKHLESFAKQLGADRVSLSAQCRVTPFYEKCGYVQVGQQYLDEGCPHIKMQKTIQ